MALGSMGSELWGFDCCFLFVVGGAENKLGSTLLAHILTPLKTNAQSVCGFGCTLLNLTQVLLNHFLTQFGFLKNEQSNKRPPA
jgi:hypothetical protein